VCGAKGVGFNSPSTNPFRLASCAHSGHGARVARRVLWRELALGTMRRRPGFEVGNVCKEVEVLLLNAGDRAHEAAEHQTRLRPAPCTTRHLCWRLQLGVGGWVLGLGLGVRVGVWGSASEFRMQGQEFRISGSGFRSQGTGLGLGFRPQGLDGRD
jgi:hypothetical protein